MTPSPRHGITLAELCVVAAILALLATLLVPAGLGAYRAALRTSCSSNLRQVGAAFLAYAQDWEGHLPADSDFGLPAARSPAWFDRLPDYLGDTPLRAARVFQCAGFRAKAATMFANASPKSLKMNGYLDDHGRPRHYRLGTAADEAEVMLMIDAVAGETGMGQWGRAVHSGVDDSRHPRKANLLALDGHGLSAATHPSDGDWEKALTWLSAGW